ncbi:hypothetical protein LP417_33955 (plasmid) [Polaromonas sp. P1-6]|nr:hypothetical protein LP417_33955 [Polaromonas sp. P1-6]
MKQSIDYPVLRRPRLTAGVGVRTAVLTWSVAGIAAMSIGLPWGLLALLPGALVHGSLAWFFKIDPKIFENYAAYSLMPNEYRAGLPMDGEEARSRPEGFGRGISL